MAWEKKAFCIHKKLEKLSFLLPAQSDVGEDVQDIVNSYDWILFQTLSLVWISVMSVLSNSISLFS